jgi:hypothetical protein
MSPIDLDKLGEFIENGVQQAAPQIAQDMASTIMGWYDQQVEEIENAEAIQAKAVRAGMKWVKLAGARPYVNRKDGGKVIPCTCGGNVFCGCNAYGGWLVPKGYKLTTCGTCGGSGDAPLTSGLFYCPGCNSAGSIAVKSK